MNELKQYIVKIEENVLEGARSSMIIISDEYGTPLFKYGRVLSFNSTWDKSYFYFDENDKATRILKDDIFFTLGSELIESLLTDCREYNEKGPDASRIDFVGDTRIWSFTTNNLISPTIEHCTLYKLPETKTAMILLQDYLKTPTSH